MSLTKNEIKHVAKLANLKLSDTEEEKYTEQLSKILEYIEQLNLVNTDGVEPTFNVSGQVNVFRADETVAGLTQDEALQNAPKSENKFFVTKRILGEES
ncbi:MAG: Asp-tRNA(Asn)/Glu-tRNA(Gln) amidotransferase subunit GatC [Candidatus Daviesbacteria bacterium]|nr:Asp-tRNA(Asn)/Glu-tRNA(Gln) amidotransferase subunit GatC [Candidatus Daviesbacteria bacterium]